MVKINDEVIMVYYEAFHDTYYGRGNSEDGPQAVIQAYLSDIWKPFDAEDEATWPEDPDPSDVFRWLVLYELASGEPFLKIASWRKREKDFSHHYEWAVPVAYLNPSDILPKEIGNE